MPVHESPEPLDHNSRDPFLRVVADEASASATHDLEGLPAFLSGHPRAAAASRIAAAPDHPSVAPVRDAATLPMAGIAPRRLVLMGVALMVAWMAVSFGRQAAEASAASTRAEELRAANAALADEVAGLERELKTIQDQRYIAQAARAFRLGSAQEVPFALKAGAPSLAPDAPGSASVRLGGDPAARGPLSRWLDVLFGPGG